MRFQCDQAKPQCSRCQKLNIYCESSVQGRWRIRTARNPSAWDSVPRSAGRGSPSTATEWAHQSNEPVDWASVSPLHRGTGRPTSPDEGAGRGTLETPKDMPAYNDDGSDAAIAVQDPVDGPPPVSEQCPHTLVTGMTLKNFLPSAFSASQPEFLVETPLLADFSFIMPDPYISNLSWGGSPSSPLSTMGHVATATEDDIAKAPRGDGDAVSDVLAALIDDILRCPAGLDESDLSRCRAHFLSLWAYFKSHVAPSLTAFARRADNPFLKYLVPRAETNHDLLIAVLYLSQTVKKRTFAETDGVEYHFLERVAGHVIQTLEPETTVMPISPADGDGWTTNMLTTLSSVLMFCMVFIANRDSMRFVQHLEYAGIICQLLFRVLSGDESFLYLAKMLGFMQNSLLFSTSGSINAPDYLSVALEFHDRNSDALRELDGRYAHHIHFRNLDMFSGLSASMASALYALGSLIKKKRAFLGHSDATDGETVRAFHCDVDGLEVRLRMHLSLLTDQKKRSVEATGNQQPPSASLTMCLNAYNEAVFWSVWTIFLTDLRDRSPTADPEVRDAAEKVLDACAEIPKQSAVAPLMLFPLAIGGMRAVKKVYREFVLHRLADLQPVGLTDTQILCIDLENWWQSDMVADSPMTFTRSFVF
ncbi:hypothetical protein Sste5344_006291 [Sporothrix stenoceras]